MLTITFYMESGNQVVVRAKEFDMTKLCGTKGNRTLNLVGTDRIWSIDLDRVEAVIAQKD